jgi:hypothetical protein
MKILNSKLKIKNGVIKFEDGTLFLRQKNQGQRQFDFLTGQAHLSTIDIDNFKQNITENESFCKLHSIEYAHVIFPCKAIAYKKEFFDIGVEINTITTSNHLAHPKVYYPEASQMTKDWFLKTDTHCSYIGYLNILTGLFNHINIEFPQLPLIIGKRFIKGDLGVMCGAEKVEVDYIERFDLDADIYRFSNRKALSGNSGEIYFNINTKPLIKKRVLLFGDSFFVGSLNVLSHIYEEVCYVRNVFILKDIALLIKPDIIFTGCAERYLTKVDNYQTSSPFFLNFFKNGTSFNCFTKETQEAFTCFFMDRESAEFLKWRKKLKFKALLKLDDINLQLLAEKDSDLLEYIRDTAISLEKNDILEAFRLMSIAKKIRPEGPLIVKKINSYIELLNPPLN